MIFATQYERIPNPRPEDWDSDFKKMREIGITMVRTWMYWKEINPAPGVWDFSHYDKLFDEAQANGIKIQIQVFVEAPPYFLERQHPEWCYQNKNGDYLPLRARQAQQIGGYPGFDYMNPEPRKKAAEYINKIAEHYRTHPALWGYDVWNEIWMSDWLDSEWCNKKRAIFLEKKYSDIETLNHAYVSQYESFDQVLDTRLADSNYTKPKQQIGGMYQRNMDSYLFFDYLAIELCQWRVDNVREFDNEHIITCHTSANPLKFDSYGIGDKVDEWGLSRHSGNLDEFMLGMHAAKLTSNNKPWWLAENSSGSIWTGLNSIKRTVEFILTNLTMAMMFNAKGVFFWQYRPEIKDAESPNYGMVKLNGKDSKRSIALSKYINMYNDNKDLFDNMEFKNSPVGIVFSPEVTKMNYVVNSNNFDDFKGWYTALSQNGCIPDILWDTRIKDEIPAHIKVLILPMQVIEIENLRKTLTKWVDNGGILIASGQTFLFDKYMYAQREYPGIELFGINEDETDEDKRPVTMFLDNNYIKMPSGGRRIDSCLHGAQPIGAIEDKIAATIYEKGKGKSIWFGCAPGRSHNYEQSDGLCSVVSSLLSYAGITPEIKASDGIVTHMEKINEEIVVYVINLTKNSISSWITFANDCTDKVKDLYNGDEIYSGSKTQSFAVALKPFQSKILLCETKS